MTRVLQAGKWDFERVQKRSKMTFLGLKMIIFGHFSTFLGFFKISFSSLQHPSYCAFESDNILFGSKNVNSRHHIVNLTKLVPCG